MAVVRTRLIIGTSIAAAVLGLIILDRVFDSAFFMMILVATCAAAAQYEFYVMVEHKEIKTFAGIGITATVLLIAGEYLVNHTQMMGKWEYANALLLLLFLVTFSMFFILVLRQGVEGSLSNLSVTIFGFFYIWGLASFILRLRFLYIPIGDEIHIDIGFFLVILLITVSKMNDSTAFFVGRAFGKRKLAPKISPGKSIAGLAGGLIGGIAGAYIVYFVFHYVSADFRIAEGHLPLLFIPVFAVLVGAVSHIGDLAESMLKRDVGVKDSSALFPEAGGFLDLIDGLLFASPMAFLVTVFLTGAKFKQFSPD